jgi:hypothetical protein
MQGNGHACVPEHADVHTTDEDFCVVEATRDDLVALQVDAEARGFGTRWSSVEALVSGVGPSPVYLRPLLRERRDGQLRSYRCLVLYSLAGAGGGGVTTFDVVPERLKQLPALTLDAQSRLVISRMFTLATGGIGFVSKD